jgi:hypothetical protein
MHLNKDKILCMHLNKDKILCMHLDKDKRNDDPHAMFFEFKK